MPEQTARRGAGWPGLNPHLSLQSPIGRGHGLRSRVAALALILFAIACAALSKGLSEQRFASLGDFRLESGEVIRDCRIGYLVAGQLNQDRSNAILVPSWFAGRAIDLDGWIGPGNLYDTARYFVIAVDALGDGVSSSPSNSSLQPAEKFPRFTIGDMVRTQHELVVRELKLDHLYAVSGLSMGGMQAFQWGATYPAFMTRLVPIVGTTRQTAADVTLWQTELDLLDSFHATREQSRNAMNAIAGINDLELYTPSWLAANVKDARAALAAHRKSLERLDPFDYMAQLRAMLALDLGTPEEVAKAITAPMLIVASLQDEMVNPGPAREVARAARATLVTLSGNCGHLATSCEKEVLIREVGRFLGEGTNSEFRMKNEE